MPCSLPYQESSFIHLYDSEKGYSIIVKTLHSRENVSLYSILTLPAADSRRPRLRNLVHHVLSGRHQTSDSKGFDGSSKSAIESDDFTKRSPLPDANVVKLRVSEHLRGAQFGFQAAPLLTIMTPKPRALVGRYNLVHTQCTLSTFAVDLDGKATSLPRRDNLTTLLLQCISKFPHSLTPSSTDHSAVRCRLNPYNCEILCNLVESALSIEKATQQSTTVRAHREQGDVCVMPPLFVKSKISIEESTQQPQNLTLRTQRRYVYIMPPSVVESKVSLKRSAQQHRTLVTRTVQGDVCIMPPLEENTNGVLNSIVNPRLEISIPVFKKVTQQLNDDEVRRENDNTKAIQAPMSMPQPSVSKSKNAMEESTKQPECALDFSKENSDGHGRFIPSRVENAKSSRRSINIMQLRAAKPTLKESTRQPNAVVGVPDVLELRKGGGNGPFMLFPGNLVLVICLLHPLRAVVLYPKDSATCGYDQVEGATRHRPSPDHLFRRVECATLSPDLPIHLGDSYRPYSWRSKVCVRRAWDPGVLVRGVLGVRTGNINSNGVVREGGPFGACPVELILLGSCEPPILCVLARVAKVEEFDHLSRTKTRVMSLPSSMRQMS